MRKTLAIAILAAISTMPVRAAGPNCVYTLSSGSVHVAWQAYKTTKRVGVHGEFKKIDAHVPTGSALAEILDMSRVTIDPASSDSGNPERDATLTRTFFSAIASPIDGSIVRAKGQDSGTFVLVLSLNGKKKRVPMGYSLAPDGTFTAQGGLRIPDFGLSSALDALHAACADRHKGDDGVSKTWPDADVKITAHIDKTCK